MEHYYLLNGTVKKGGEMPDARIYNHDIFDAADRFSEDYNNWMSSLQPCEIDESELEKVKEYLEMSTKIDSYLLPNTEITNIIRVEEIRTETKSGGWTDYKIYFKQPTEKQVESDAVEFAEWIALSKWEYNGNTETWYNYTETIFPTTKQLYEIFKNR